MLRVQRYSKSEQVWLDDVLLSTLVSSCLYYTSFAIPLHNVHIIYYITLYNIPVRYNIPGKHNSILHIIICNTYYVYKPILQGNASATTRFDY